MLHKQGVHRQRDEYGDYYNELYIKLVDLAGKLRPKDHQQLSLFEDVEEVKEQESLDKAVDKIRDRYGFGSLVHASSLLPRTTEIKRSRLIGGHKIE